MARPRSIYEQKTKSVTPPPERREREYLVKQGDSLLSIANKMYPNQEYDGNLWRLVATRNGVIDTFAFADDFLGRVIRIPAEPLPAFT